MATFAKLDLNNIVMEVLVVHNNELLDSNGVEQEANGIAFLTNLTGDSLWKQTSYNTRGNVHYGEDGEPDEGIALRGNYAGIGYTYDADNDVFYEPKPYASWTLGTNSWLWNPPITYPDDDIQYVWDEDLYQADNTKGWVEG